MRAYDRAPPQRKSTFPHCGIRGAAHPERDVFAETQADRRPPQHELEVDAVFGLRCWPMDVPVYTPQGVERLRDESGCMLAMVGIAQFIEEGASQAVP